MNVLVYVVDCLRADHLSSYGYDRETSPSIDAVAADGVRYEQCFTPATWTRPASVSLLTGMYPPAHGVRHREDRFSKALPRLPTALSSAGYSTHAFSTMGNVSSALGYNVGFDTFDDMYKDETLIERRRRNSASREKLLYEDREEIALPRAEDITDRVKPVFERSDSNQFVFCWGIDLHMPLYPPDEDWFLNPNYAGQFDGSFASIPDEPTEDDIQRLRDHYDNQLRYTDEQFGVIVEALKRRDIYDETLIVVLGDHGEAFNEHDFLFHGNQPYEELLHIPLIVKPPGSSEQTVVPDLSSLVDIAPTILDILGIGAGAMETQGRVLEPFHTAQRNDNAVFSETNLQEVKPTYYSVRTDRWKYIKVERPKPRTVLQWLYAHRSELPSRRFALATIRDSLQWATQKTNDQLLYDLEVDPGERRNLASSRPETTERLHRTLERWLSECADINRQQGASATVDIDADTVEQLRQLGYTE